MCESLPPGTVNEYSLPYNCFTCASKQTMSAGKCFDTGSISLLLRDVIIIIVSIVFI